MMDFSLGLNLLVLNGEEIINLDLGLTKFLELHCNVL